MKDIQLLIDHLNALIDAPPAGVERPGRHVLVRYAFGVNIRRCHTVHAWPLTYNAVSERTLHNMLQGYIAAVQNAIAFSDNADEIRATFRGK